MSLESLFSAEELQEIQDAEVNACIEAFVFSSPQEQAFIDNQAKKLAKEFGPEKTFPAKTLAIEAINGLRQQKFRTDFEEAQYMETQIRKIQLAWGEKKIPVAMLTKTHEFSFDESGERVIAPRLKLYSGFQTGAVLFDRSFADWDLALNVDPAHEPIDLKFEEPHILIYEGYLLDSNWFAQTNDIPIQIPYSRIERIFYLDPNHTPDPV